MAKRRELLKGIIVKLDDSAFRQGLVEGFTGIGLFAGSTSRILPVTKFPKAKSALVRKLRADARDRRRRAQALLSGRSANIG